MSQRYLRQLKSGHIYHWTPTLAKRNDMVEISVDTAKARIDAMLAARAANEVTRKEQIENEKAEIAELQAISKQMADLELEAEANELRKQAEARASDQKQEYNPDDIIPTKAVDPAVAEEERKNAILLKDREYQSILAMKTIESVKDYLAANFGLKIEGKRTLEQLRVIALEKRSERIFEV